MSAKWLKTYKRFAVLSCYTLKKSKNPLISFVVSELIRIFAVQNACICAHEADKRTLITIKNDIKYMI